MLQAWVLGVSAATGLVAGLMIGCIGVGGVILVPILTQLDGVQIHTAVASCMFSYIFAGLTGLLIYRRCSCDCQRICACLWHWYFAPRVF